MKNCILTACFLLAIVLEGTISTAEEPPSRLDVDISAWLRRQPKDDDSWKGRKEFPYSAVISNASADPTLLQFVASLRRFTKFKSSEWPGKGGDYLESLVIENTTLTAEQARQLEPIATERLTISNCEVSDEVAKSLGSIKVAGSLSLKRLRLSDQALISLGRIECVTLALDQFQMSNQALSGFLASRKLRVVKMSEIRGCTADGWRGLSKRDSLGLNLESCDFDDQALLHLASSKCESLHVKNAQLTGSTLGSSKHRRIASAVWYSLTVRLTIKGYKLSQSFPNCKFST